MFVVHPSWYHCTNPEHQDFDQQKPSEADMTDPADDRAVDPDYGPGEERDPTADDPIAFTTGEGEDAPGQGYQPAARAEYVKVEAVCVPESAPYDSTVRWHPNPSTIVDAAYVALPCCICSHLRSGLSQVRTCLQIQTVHQAARMSPRWCGPL
jgi:hypothetical protein